MAGYGHGSATGIDERTLGRVDLLLFDADYPDVDAAVEDSWRIAVLASDPRLQGARERTRAEAVRTANARRDPTAATVTAVGTMHRGALGVALVLAIVAAGLILTVPSGSLTLNATMLPAGMAAGTSAALLWWLEPRRAGGALWGSRAPAVLHLACAGLWLVAAAVALLARWAEVDPRSPYLAATGLALLIAAAIAMLMLWPRALRADRAGGQSGPGRTVADLVDRRDAEEVLSELDAWWRSAGPAAMARNADRVRRVRIEVLARLRQATLITELDEQFVRSDPAPSRWSERRDPGRGGVARR